jgi:putative DNA methylase
MVFDFAEANALGESVGAWSTCSDYVADCVEVLNAGQSSVGHARQHDAASGVDGLRDLIVSTDPPYYDNISYATLSDFFYVWLRRAIGDLHPELFSTVLTPKMPELIASADRFGGKREAAKDHFESGFRRAFNALGGLMDSRFPLTVYYAFKQDDESAGDNEDSDDETSVDLTTGWETLLEALIASGFQITGTWPVRASQKWRMVSMGANALASYIVLACRPRPANAPQTDRRSFVAELKRELPAALRHLQQGNIAPVDFAQAAIGPGMAIYSRYSRILESSGKAMTVRTALSLINQTLTEVLSEQVDEFDADTRWAIAWFEQQGFGEGDFGAAELLSKAKVTAVSGLQQAGLIHSKSGKVRLLRPDELPSGWDPAKDKRRTIWEMTHHLLRVYVHEKAGDAATAELLRKLGSQGEIARDLAYRLFSLCEKKKRSQEAQAYNALVLGWPEIARLAHEPMQTSLPGN